MATPEAAGWRAVEQVTARALWRSTALRCGRGKPTVAQQGAPDRDSTSRKCPCPRPNVGVAGCDPGVSRSLPQVEGVLPTASRVSAVGQRCGVALAEVGDHHRFATEARFTRWCGTGAVAVSSGEGAD